MKKFILLIILSLFLVVPVNSQETKPNNDLDIIYQILNIFTNIPQGSGNTGSTNSFNSEVSGSDAVVGGNPNAKFFCQGDPQWQFPYNIAGTGCGPTSVAIVMNSFGVARSPSQVAEAMYPNFYNGDVSYMQAMLQNKSFPDSRFQIGPNLVNGSALDTYQAKKYIQEGYLIIASSAVFPCTPGGCTATKRNSSNPTVNHIFVVDNISDDTQHVSVQDPSNCQYGVHNSPQDSRYTSYNASAFPWLYAFPVKLGK